MGNFLDLDELNILKITFRNGLENILRENLVGNLAGNLAGNLCGWVTKHRHQQFLARFLLFLGLLQAIKHHQTIFFL